MSELSSILDSIATSGWLVRYLGQLADGRWFACLWLADDDGLYLTPDAIGADPASALASAFSSNVAARFLPYARPNAAEGVSPFLSRPEFTLASLGLAPKPTFTSPLRRGRL